MDYEVKGRPATAIYLGDGDAVHVETYEGFIAVTWSTYTKPGEFLRRGLEELKLGKDTRGLVVFEGGTVYEDLDPRETLKRADLGGCVVVRLDDSTQVRSVAWEVPPGDKSGSPEAGVAAAALERSTVERLLRETSAKSIHSAASEVLAIVEKVTSRVWRWRGEIGLE